MNAPLPTTNKLYIPLLHPTLIPRPPLPRYLERRCLTLSGAAALEAHTQDWLAGLQLASPQGYDDENITQLVVSLAGRHRFTLDYSISSNSNQNET